MAVAYAAIGNNGSVLRPFIVQYAKSPGGGSEEIGKRKGVNSLPITRDHLKMIQDALRDQTSNTWGGGSSKVFADFDYPIAGKTGTAQNELDRSGKPHAWFAAYGPYGQKVTIASIVMVESSGEGVTYSAPRTKEIFEAYLKTDLPKSSANSS
jgi:penicillin-binding protein 2